MLSVTERVDKGITILPEDWRARITRPIDMRSGSNCVLGQLFGGYWSVLECLWPGSVEAADALAVKHGFQAMLDAETGLRSNSDQDYQELTIEWNRRLAA